MNSQGKGKQKDLLDQRQALHSYLGDLLNEVPENETQLELVQAAKLQSQTDTQPSTQQNIMQNSIVEIDEDAKASRENDASLKKNTENETNIPEWARDRFQCLLFKVSGTSLALPLVKLNGVIPWSDNISPARSDFKAFLGTLRYLDQNVHVIDTAQVILPEKHQETFLTLPDERLHNIVLIDNGRWGLVCDEVGEVITLGPEEVSWRFTQGKLKWLSGTVLQHLCALIDVDVFAGLLQEECKLENPEEKG